MVQGASPSPSPTPELIYELAEPTTTQGYDTGVKLFESPMSFTILCDVTFANRGWSNVSNVNSVFGISTGPLFRVGACPESTASDYRNGEFFATEKRYTALVMNASDDDPKKCTSLLSRMSTTAASTHRIAVRYDHTMRKVEGFTESIPAPTARWFNIGSLVSSNTLKFFLGSATGTMNIFRVYDGLLSDADLNTFLSGN